MTHILFVDAQKLIEQAAEQLKAEKLVQAPEWSKFVKTGPHKQRLPDNPDWWYMRSAAILRSVAKLGPVGTSKLRTKFGGNKNRGNKPNRFMRSSGAIIRNSLQQLEAAGLIKQEEKGNHKGRVLTPKGVSFLDKLAVPLAKEERADGKK